MMEAAQLTAISLFWLDRVHCCVLVVLREGAMGKKKGKHGGMVDLAVVVTSPMMAMFQVTCLRWQGVAWIWKERIAGKLRWGCSWVFIWECVGLWVWSLQFTKDLEGDDGRGKGKALGYEGDVGREPFMKMDRVFLDSSCGPLREGGSVGLGLAKVVDGLTHRVGDGLGLGGGEGSSLGPEDGRLASDRGLGIGGSVWRKGGLGKSFVDVVGGTPIVDDGDATLVSSVALPVLEDVSTTNSPTATGTDRGSWPGGRCRSTLIEHASLHRSSSRISSAIPRASRLVDVERMLLDDLTLPLVVQFPRRQRAALKLGLLSSDEFDMYVVPEKMIGPTD
ncbi:hypothetical protein Dimus_016319 [Dionaea muscipula]